MKCCWAVWSEIGLLIVEVESCSSFSINKNCFDICRCDGVSRSEKMQRKQDKNTWKGVLHICYAILE